MGKIIPIRPRKSEMTELYQSILKRGEEMKVPVKQDMTLEQFEAFLAGKYKGRICSFTYPGYDTVYGMCEEIAVDVLKLPAKEIIIQLGKSDGIHRYTCSVETLTECLKILKDGTVNS